MRSLRPKIPFTPVRLKARRDGWTADRQVRFIHALAATRSVSRACAAVGMSRESAYKLRERPEAADGFARAWQAALDFNRRQHVARLAAGHRKSLSAATVSSTLETLVRRLGAELAAPPSR